jgi:hypothetical protein
LTPSFNQAPWLQDNLRSVAAQTYRSIEHVVMDGGSSDGSVDVLVRNTRPGLIWRSEPDSGQSHALNKAFGQSRGEVIGWLNSDDAYCDRRTVEWAVDVFQSHPDVDVVYGFALLVNEVNTVLQVIASPPLSRRMLEAVNYIYQPTAFIRRTALQGPTPFLREDLHYVMDRDLWLRLSPRSRFHRLARPMAIDRHQRQRKVMTADYKAEANRFDAHLGIANSAGSKALAMTVRVYIRVAGLLPMLLLPWQIDEAIALRIPSLPRRVWQQAAVRRRQFTYAPDAI